MIDSQTPCRDLEVISCTPAKDTSLVDLVLSAPGWTCKPGQFVMLRPAHWGLELVWPRPFSVCDVSDAGLRILFQTVGRGTQRLAGLTPGQKVTVWGPLGRWFRIDETRPNLILAGGVGIAPFVMLARREKTDNLSMLFGHRLDLAHYPFAEIGREAVNDDQTRGRAGGECLGDLGLGAVVGDPLQNGKFKVSSLRNIDLTPPYGHNGFFKSLEEIVFFYHWRAAKDGGMCGDGMGGGMGGGGMNCENMATMFPPPEVDQNRTTLDMFPRPQVDNIVTFLKTLSDGYFER